MATAAPEIPVVARDLAFERLYRRHVKDVYHYALAILRNPADAEDVTQTTFLNAYRALERGVEPRKPHNWLIKIAHNAARTRYARSTRRVSEVPLEDHIESLAVPEEDKPDLREVLDALGELPLNQRGALVMRELEGRSYTDIAETLGVSVPAVETLIFRARRSLKLKASAVRALGAVPLPGSLAQLFDGGLVVAGGGAALGSGFLLKAAVAIVAGALATGVTGGEHAQRAEAAPAGKALAAPPWNAVGTFSRPGGLAELMRPSSRSAAASGSTLGPGVASHGRRLVDGDAGAASDPTVKPVVVEAAPSPKASSPSAAPTLSVPSLPVAVSPEPVTTAVPPVSVPAPALTTLPAPPATPSLPPVSLPTPLAPPSLP
jgi:RNA polymerase sigma factor (sigma-70 family)